METGFGENSAGNEESYYSLLPSSQTSHLRTSVPFTTDTLIRFQSLEFK